MAPKWRKPIILGLAALLLTSVIVGLFILKKSNSHEVFETLVVDGIKRSYILHLPANYDSHRSWPLVIALHGGG